MSLEEEGLRVRRIISSRSSSEKERNALVPPPTVPTSIEGMLQVMSRSFPSLIASMSVMQLELSTFSTSEKASATGRDRAREPTTHEQDLDQ